MRPPSLLSGRGSSSAPCIFTCRFSRRCFSPLAPGCSTSLTAFSMDSATQGELLRERHHFHARHRTAFLSAASLLVVLLAWFVLTRMRPEALRDDSWIGSLPCFISSPFTAGPAHATRWLPKELAVAILFASATAVPAWSRLGAGRHRIGERAAGARRHLLCRALLDQLRGHRKVGRAAILTAIHPLGQPAPAFDRNHDCAVFAGRGPACAFARADGGLSGGPAQQWTALCTGRAQLTPFTRCICASPPTPRC